MPAANRLIEDGSFDWGRHGDLGLRVLLLSLETACEIYQKWSARSLSLSRELDPLRRVCLNERNARPKDDCGPGRAEGSRPVAVRVCIFRADRGAAHAESDPDSPSVFRD